MKSAVLLGVLGLASRTLADPTWPSEIDELEEIMFQLESFRARKFADTVSPCNNEASGPGRLNAAEWLRTAFHDMSTASVYFETGGLDASLQYELSNSENLGPGLTTTIEFMAPYISSRSSLSDLIAMGVYMSVRSCGGPAVPIRAGRKDATTKGNTGVPQPQNSVLTFQQQFDRMGFTGEEMIQVTACGHSIGSVHSEQFPDIVLAGTGEDDQKELDTSAAVFDNKVVTEYLDGTTKNPLVVGPAVKAGKHSDFKVFNSDNNATMEGLTNQETFNSVCKKVLQKMIDVVPPGVTLTDPIAPYEVKPVNLQLTLSQGGKTLRFTGYIRVRTTDIPEDDIESVTITYKNRDGKSSCGSGGCSITATVQGVSQGFDDTFAFFPIATDIPASTGISSFVVTVNYVDGSQDEYDNNGKEYPLQDAVLLQLPQTCLLGSSGALTVTAAVRNDRVNEGAKASISYKTAQSNSPAPKLQSNEIDLDEGDCVGEYTFFTTEWTIPGGLAYEAYIDVNNGDASDSFKSAAGIGGTCRPFANPAACAGGAGPSSPVSSTPGPTPTDDVPTGTTTPVPTPTGTLHHRDAVGGYVLVSCWTEGDGIRALSGSTYTGDDMTLESCMEFCSDFVYWGTEYGQECK